MRDKRGKRGKSVVQGTYRAYRAYRAGTNKKKETLGKLLDIAHSVPHLARSAAEDRPGTAPQARSETPAEAAPSAGDLVRDILTDARKPVPHPLIVQAVQRRGYSKEQAKAAIADAQRGGRIEHNLTTGYVFCAVSAVSLTGD